MYKQLIYTVHVGRGANNEGELCNEVNCYINVETAFQWFLHAVREAPQYFGKELEVLSHWEHKQIDVQRIDECGPQTIAEYSANLEDGMYLVRLDAHLVNEPKHSYACYQELRPVNAKF